MFSPVPVRPGDETVNTPEKAPQGERLTYTAGGVTVTYYDGTPSEAATPMESNASRWSG